jgi:hypothetical protein
VLAKSLVKSAQKDQLSHHRKRLRGMKNGKPLEGAVKSRPDGQNLHLNNIIRHQNTLKQATEKYNKQKIDKIKGNKILPFVIN